MTDMPETPMIAFHGGKCCGIKTIHNLGEDPSATAEGIVKETRNSVQTNPDQCNHDVSSSVNMYNEDCPEETYLERIDRYIKWLQSPSIRPNGVIEIVLAQEVDPYICDCGECDDVAPEPNQVGVWGPLLLLRGFVEVNSCYNSNSGNRIHIYHLKTDKFEGIND